MSSSSSSRISRHAAGKAVDSILKWITARSRTQPEKLDDSLLYLVLTLKRIPHRGRPHSFPLPLPHPFPLDRPASLDKRRKKKKAAKSSVPLTDFFGSTVLHFRGGTCSGIKVGRASQPREEIVDNVMAAVEGAVGRVPKKWANVRSFHVKAAESLAIPIYQSVPDLDLNVDEGEGEDGGLGEERTGKRKSDVKMLEDGEGMERKRRKVGLESD